MVDPLSLALTQPSRHGPDAMTALVSERVLSLINSLERPWLWLIGFGVVLGLLMGLLVQQVRNCLRAEERQLPWDILLIRAAGLGLGLVLANLLVAPLLLLPLPESLQPVKPLALVLVNLLLGVAGLTVGQLRGQALRHLLGSTSSETLLLEGDLVQRSAPKILDTSAAIDGRIGPLLDSGLLEGQVIIPQVVLEELQTLADSGKGEKRSRGRRGLDSLSALRRDYGRRIVTNSTRYDGETVDEKLLQLTSDTSGILITTDYTLAQVGRLRNLRVLSLSELVVALRPNAQPGDQFHLKLVRQGKEPEQAIAYLEDGTMVVVDGAQALIGQSRNVTITGALQTNSGRMMFGQLSPKVGSPETGQSSPRSNSRGRRSR